MLQRIFRLLALAALGALVVAVCPQGAQATNGMYLTGYGAETVGRAGANLAISDRGLAINFNPAGISQLQGNHLIVSFSLLAPELEFENLINQPVAAEDSLFPLPAVAYVRGAEESRWSWGIGLVAQGGMGAEFQNLNTFFGTRDDTFSEVRFGTVTPTVAYSINEDMAVGATLNIGYADVDFRFFPNTSFFNAQDPQNSFFGMKMTDVAGGLQSNLRLGWWWRATPKLALGAIYQTETDSNFEGGELLVNFDAHPFLGQRVSYDADVDGFTFAAQAGVGIAYRASERWTVAVDLKRYFWDAAIDVIEVRADNPENPFAPPELVIPFVFNWEDQWVYALGVDYRLNDRVTLRGGYNFGENPVPDGTLNPLFPATVENHLSFGVSWLQDNRVYEFALEHAFNKSQTNNNLDPRVNPFGPGARVDHSQWTASFSVSWAWARKNR
jgi:long-chain fatty acid transport protein